MNHESLFSCFFYHFYFVSLLGAQKIKHCLVAQKKKKKNMYTQCCNSSRSSCSSSISSNAFQFIINDLVVVHDAPFVRLASAWSHLERKDLPFLGKGL